MKNRILALILSTAFLFGGCQHVYETAQVQTGSEQVASIRVADLPPVYAAELVEAGLDLSAVVEVRSLPEEILPEIDRSKVKVIDVPLYEEVPQVSRTAELVLAGISKVPIPYADVLSYVLSGGLGIGALWMRKRLKTSEKVAQSVIQGVDTFRNVLDQTPEGEKIDEALKAALRERQGALGVVQEIDKLLSRWKTPTVTGVKFNVAKS